MRDGGTCASCQNSKYEERTEFTFFKLCLFVVGGVFIHYLFVWGYGWAILKYTPLIVYKGAIGIIVVLNFINQIMRRFDWDKVFN